MIKTIHQTIYLSATPGEVFECLMDEKKHGEFTGASAIIDKKVGGKFSVWNGYATGINKELIEGKKIVQSWRASEWPEGVESEVIFELSQEGDKTKLDFTQTGVPEEFFDDVARGWEDFYWKTLQKYLTKK